MGLWDRIVEIFKADPEPDAASGPSASDVMKQVRSEKRQSDSEWERLTLRLATLVLSGADRQRLWKRAHRGADGAARLLSGIVAPTPEEKRILAGLVQELEAGR